MPKLFPDCDTGISSGEGLTVRDEERFSSRGAGVQKIGDGKDMRFRDVREVYEFDKVRSTPNLQMISRSANCYIGQWKLNHA